MTVIPPADVRAEVETWPALSPGRLHELADILGLVHADCTCAERGQPSSPRNAPRPQPEAAHRASPEPAPERMFLYRFYDGCEGGGCLLYVGITNDFSGRHANHADNAPWYEYQVRHEVEDLKADSREAAFRAEREVIRAELPAFNQTGQRPELGASLIKKYLTGHLQGGGR